MLVSKQYFLFLRHPFSIASSIETRSKSASSKCTQRKKTRNDSTVLRNAYINMVTEINIFQSYESEALTRIIVCNVSL